MSHSVTFYEKEFNKSVAAARTVINIRNGIEHVDMTESMIVIGMTNALPNMNAVFPEILAAIHILELYTKTTKINHLAEAEVIKTTLSLCIQERSVRLAAFATQTVLKTLFYIAVTKTLNDDIHPRMTLLTTGQKDTITKAFTQQSESPSYEVQKQFLAATLTPLIKAVDLVKQKSDFASVCFTLITKLNLSIEPTIMRKLIYGANFSTGLFGCGTRNARRESELQQLEVSESHHSSVQPMRLNK